MYIAQIVESSAIYGPGNRFVIWVQGCSLHCSGCWNKAMWAFGIGDVQSIENLILKIIQIPDIEGITILGGEPFDQYTALLNLVKQIKTTRLTVMLYTGYELAELEAKNQTEIFEYIDILITGRYLQTHRNTNLQWIGSSNQQIHFLSAAYKNYQTVDANYTEIEIDAFGKITILGFPTKEHLQKIILL